jgi:hypothetical protein
MPRLLGAVYKVFDAELSSRRIEGADRRQNGTRHRWRNPLPEPCLMAFISVGGKRG